jgi:hypothetical protein
MTLTTADNNNILRKIESLTAEKIRVWIVERQENCLRIANTKPIGLDRDGWLDDAAYFAGVLGLIDWTADEYAENGGSNRRTPLVSRPERQP